MDNKLTTGRGTFCLMALLVAVAVGVQAGELHEAAGKGDGAGVTNLLAKGADVNGRDENGATALHRAAASARKEVVELLLAKGADPRAKCNAGKTPLHEAGRAYYSNAFVDLLLPEFKTRNDPPPVLISRERCWRPKQTPTL